MYFFLFHGRENPTMDMDERGPDGPVIGPCRVSYTYGGIKLHDIDNGEEHGSGWALGIPVATEGDCIRCGGVYYGEAEVWNADDLQGKLDDLRVVSVSEWATSMNGK